MKRFIDQCPGQAQDTPPFDGAVEFADNTLIFQLQIGNLRGVFELPTLV